MMVNLSLYEGGTENKIRCICTSFEMQALVLYWYLSYWLISAYKQMFKEDLLKCSVFNLFSLLLLLVVVFRFQFSLVSVIFQSRIESFTLVFNCRNCSFSV